MQTEKVFCATCGAECVPEGCTTGYGQDRDGRAHCFACCAERERESMIATGKAVLYLTVESAATGGPAWKIKDWPGRLAFSCNAMRDGKHNIARTRKDAWFHGPDGFLWHGVQYGENTQIIHCRRTRHAADTNDTLLNAAYEKLRTEVAC